MYPKDLVNMDTRRVFSFMGIDQAHKQNNAAVKGEGGAVNLTQNPEPQVAGPQVMRRKVHMYIESRSNGGHSINHVTVIRMDIRASYF